MGFGAVISELLTPEITLPVQFQRIWNESRTTTPERTLAISVLCQAAEDLQMFRYARRWRQQRLYVDAYAWIVSADRRWPYSFLNLCDAFRLSPDCVRAELLGNTRSRGPSRFRAAARRSSRPLRVGSLSDVARKRPFNSLPIRVDDLEDRHIRGRRRSGGGLQTERSNRGSASHGVAEVR
jgi:hypothetical protein